jgi:hypothetical protein
MRQAFTGRTLSKQGDRVTLDGPWVTVLSTQPITLADHVTWRLGPRGPTGLEGLEVGRQNVRVTSLSRSGARVLLNPSS